MVPSTRIGVLALGLAAVGCGERGGSTAADEPTGRASVEPDVVVASLVEDLRIGALRGDGVHGQLLDLALEPTGGVIVHDIQAGRLLRYDAEGRARRAVGSLGSGPGEYDGLNGVAVSSEGEVFVRSMDGRILVFGPDGSYVRGWRQATRLMHEPKLTVSDDGLLVIQETLVRPDAPFQIATRGFIRVTPEGEVVDTLGPFLSGLEDQAVSTLPTHPRKHLEWSPAGFAISGVSSLVRLTLATPDGAVAVASVEHERPSYPSDELAQWVAHAEWLRTRVADPALIPDPAPVKPSYHRIVASRTGEVWVWLSSPSTEVEPGWVAEAYGAPRVPEWRFPLRLVVFDPSGRLVARFEGPPGFEPKAASGDSLWGYAKGDFGEQYIVRLVRSDRR